MSDIEPTGLPNAQGADGPLTRDLQIVNKKGLHARASRKLAELALNYESTRIMVRREDDEADARSLMDLMMLGAGLGCEIEVEADGPQAAEAVEAIAALGGVTVGSNVFALDVDAATRSILGDPYVAKATVTRRLPGTIAISVVEREARATALVGEDLFLVTAEGEIFKKVGPDDAVDLVSITGITETLPVCISVSSSNISSSVPNPPGKTASALARMAKCILRMAK